jgi:uncharacterized lipoprotein YbaY
MTNPGPIPISFRLAYDATKIDPNHTYSVQASIVDGTAAWATAGGSLVITKGNPTSDIPLTLTYRPNLLKGAVTGDLTGVGIAPSTGAYGVAVLVDPGNGSTLGIQYLPAVTAVPAAFSVPFDPTTIDQSADYVVQGAIVDGPARWTNTTGVPAITKGNPLSGLQVVLTSATPAPAPIPEEDSGSRIGSWLLLLILLGILIGSGYYIYRSRRPPPGPATAAAVAAGPMEGDVAGADGIAESAAATGAVSSTEASGAETAAEGASAAETTAAEGAFAAGEPTATAEATAAEATAAEAPTAEAPPVDEAPSSDPPDPPAPEAG